MSAEHLGDTACTYAALGQSVFPCRPRDKRPLPACRQCAATDCPGPQTCGHELCHGFLDATTDVDAAHRWWRHDERRNIGGRPAAGIAVVDIDPRDGGDQTWSALTAGHAVPETLTCSTGGGGWHCWFGVRGPIRGSLGAGIQVKSHKSGYLVLPPSVHPSGRRYEWVDDEMPVADAPGWLVKLLTPPKPATTVFDRSSSDPSRRAQGLLSKVLAAQPGQRNSLLFWACCRAIEAGLDVNPLIEAGQHIGLPPSEAWRIGQSAARRSAAR